ncbi:MAG: RsmF rRNA methyltransferase first C-terminal domain-containing protein [Bacteroidaceae bacterium]|nr:RsmF rRNA methyltransferase first C-terminal domain-containing protein [Bacteroidaceae bacterium]
MNLNDNFEARTLSLFGNERYERFATALNEEPVVSVRLNDRKPFATLCGEPVPWAPEGRYLPARPAFTADPLFHAGCYYVQEASSMFLGQVVRQLVNGPVRALDLCAAPGGKTTHLLQSLPAGSLLVSNEPMPLRAQVLAENVIKWGAAAAVVTKNEPADFAPFKNFFDLIVVDAPCSGEGMFRKDSFAVEQWSESVVKQCAARQKEILADVWGCLRPGGLLVYSTCTFNAAEDEECVQWIASELGAEPVALQVDSAWGITPSLTDSALPVYRFIPGFTRGEGFFLAVLRKEGSVPVVQPRPAKMQPVAAKMKAEVAGWLKVPADFDIIMQGENITALPREHSAAMVALQQKLRVLHAGVPLATVKNNKLLPLHTLAMSEALERDAFNCVAVEREQALAYLHREALAFPGAPVGHLLLIYDGAPIGFVKNVGNRANNLYPAEWRIRKNPMEL